MFFWAFLTVGFYCIFFSEKEKKDAASILNVNLKKISCCCNQNKIEVVINNKTNKILKIKYYE